MVSSAGNFDNFNFIFESLMVDGYQEIIRIYANCLGPGIGPNSWLSSQIQQNWISNYAKINSVYISGSKIVY